MKNNQFIILALFIIFFSCKKEEPSYTEVSGSVYEQGTNNTKTVANALVELQWRIPKTYGAEVYHLDSVRTDENGRFKLSADAPSKNLYVFASAYRHFPGGELTMRPNVKRGQNQKVNIELTPYSWIKMNIVNTLGNDRIGINRILGGGVDNFFSSKDTTFYSIALGNSSIYISCFRYKTPNLRESTQYAVNTIGQDTVEVYIEF
tara:strand:+ start:466 stop:1080 length:615 start_codon:yes stop_codon:yes gene_type:complete